MSDFFATQAAVSSFGMAYLDFSCLMGVSQPFLSSTLVFAVGPLLILACTEVVSRCAKIKRQVMHTTIVVIAFLFQPTLTDRTLAVFACVELGRGQFYMAENLSVQCWSSQHLWLVACLGVPMLLLYVVGIPLGFFLLMYRNRAWVHDQSATPGSAEYSFKRSFSFLWRGYRVDKGYQKYWEVIIVFRKSLVQVVAVFLAFNTHAQSVIGFAVVVGFLILHSRSFPFQERRFNHLELLSLMCTVSAALVV